MKLWVPWQDPGSGIYSSWQLSLMQKQSAHLSSLCPLLGSLHVEFSVSEFLFLFHFKAEYCPNCYTIGSIFSGKFLQHPLPWTSQYRRKCWARYQKRHSGNLFWFPNLIFYLVKTQFVQTSPIEEFWMFSDHKLCLDNSRRDSYGRFGKKTVTEH